MDAMATYAGRVRLSQNLVVATPSGSGQQAGQNKAKSLDAITQLRRLVVIAPLAQHQEGMDGRSVLPIAGFHGIAMSDTGQSRRVANFLLSWWNATSCGGFDLAEFWSIDAEIADDMLLVIGLIRQTRAYPDTLGTENHGQFKALVALWRPDVSDARLEERLRAGSQPIPNLHCDLAAGEPSEKPLVC